VVTTSQYLDLDIKPLPIVGTMRGQSELQANVADYPMQDYWRVIGVVCPRSGSVAADQ
jgi:hypothetical protein